MESLRGQQRHEWSVLVIATARTLPYVAIGFLPCISIHHAPGLLIAYFRCLIVSQALMMMFN